MNMLWLLIPISLGLGAIGLAMFFWSLRTGQYDDLDGAAERILFDDETPFPADPQPSDRPPDERALPRRAD